MASSIQHGVQSSTLADVLERVLDKGVVVAGDIRVRIADIELIAIQIRLVDWSVNNPTYQKLSDQTIDGGGLARLEAALTRMEQRLDRLEPLAPALEAQQTAQTGQFELHSD